MKRFTKVSLWICGISLLLGILLMSVSWAMGFRGYHPYTTHDWELVERNEKVEGDIQNIEFKIRAGSIVVEEGDSFAITAATAGNHFKNEVRDGTWIIEEAEVHEKGSSIGGFYVDNEGVYLKSSLGEVHVTVPRNAHLKNINIEIQGGALEIETIHCDSLAIDVQAGGVDFTADVEHRLDVKCQAGGVDGILMGSEDDFNADISCNVGSVTVGDFEWGGLVIGQDRINMDGVKEMEISCDVGSVDIGFSKEE